MRHELLERCGSGKGMCQLSRQDEHWRCPLPVAAAAVRCLPSSIVSVGLQTNRSPVVMTLATVGASFCRCMHATRFSSFAHSNCPKEVPSADRSPELLEGPSMYACWRYC
jgi:hypothetical protein